MQTGISFSAAAAVSTTLKPVARTPIYLIDGQAEIISLVIRVLFVITASALPMRLITSSLFVLS